MKKFLKCFLFFIFLSVIVYCFFKYFNIKQYNVQIVKEQQKIIDIAENTEETEEESKINFKGLMKVNSDIVAWITINGTNINYPIVQGKDNSYYLTHSFYKEYSKYGTIYMDATAKKDFTSVNTFIYGHYTSQNIMFGEIGNYLKQSFYENHNEIFLYTPTKNYIVKIFSTYMDEAISKSYQMNFTSKAEYKDYVKLISNKSVIHSEIEPNIDIDRIITLYTCTKWTSKEKQSRYFIHGIIREI